MTGDFKKLVVLTCIVALVEWGLFELARMPYRPPADMRTFLGREKYAVFLFMGATALVGGGLILYFLATSTLLIRDYLFFTALIGVLLMLARMIVWSPPWSVTPLELLLH